MFQLPDFVEDYLNKIINISVDIKSIWLFGSQVNNYSRPDSDWDFLIFSNEDFYKFLINNPDLNNKKIDLLVCYNNEEAFAPWASKAKDGSIRKKHLNLNNLKWKVKNNNFATYVSIDRNRKPDFIDNVGKTYFGNGLERENKAYMIWSPLK
jgi:predicted nucleotidyltransferase